MSQERDMGHPAKGVGTNLRRGVCEPEIVRAIAISTKNRPPPVSVNPTVIEGIFGMVKNVFGEIFDDNRHFAV
jgi:hypothetical protein